jgi:hypothetical protein
MTPGRVGFLCGVGGEESRPERDGFRGEWWCVGKEVEGEWEEWEKER